MYKNILLIVALLVVCFIYFFFDPREVVWLPRCFFHELTGLNCPACGNQRVLHAIMHAHWIEAWHFNPFLFVSLPYLLSLLFIKFGKIDSKYTIVKILTHRIMIYIYVIMLCLWWIGRNIFSV